MATVMTHDSTSYWHRFRTGLVALVAIAVMTIAIVAAATSGSGSSTPTHPGTGRGALEGLCVAHGGAKIC
jgi:hypothetical protein